MDDAWQAKAAPTWRSPPPPPHQLPPPTVAAPVAGSSNQVGENALPIFHSFVAQEARLQEHSMVQESLFLNSQNVGPHRLGKTELDNSVLPLLSGHTHNLSSDFLHSLSSTSGEPTFHAQGDGATICGTNISVTGISTSEIYEKTASGKGKAYPFVSSRPLFVSTRNRSSVLHNSNQVGDYCYLGSDSAQPVLHQVIQAHDKRLPVSSMKRSWRNVSNTVDTSLQHTLHNQKFKKMPVEVMSASSGHASSVSSGRPHVFCLNTVGELFVNERGRLGVICFCHNLNMSVAKFCEWGRYVLTVGVLQHSGSSASNPGDAVRMENGITLSQWCKLSFGLRAPGNNYEWDQPVSSSARGGYRLHHNNFSYLSKNPGTSQSIESFMGARSGEPWNNSAHYNHGAAGPYAFEKSTDSVKNNAHQWNVSHQSDFLRCSSSPSQSVTPALANNHSMLAKKGSPIMVSFGALNTKANNGAQSVGHELFDDSVNNTNRWGNHSIIYPCVDAKRSSNQNYNNSWGNFSSKQIVEGGNGSSNTELRLGQPSQNNTAFFGSYPVTKHPHQSREMLDSQRQQLCKPLTHGTICPRETNNFRPNVQCTVPEPSTLDRRSLLEASSNNNASSSSEADGAVAYAAKNSAISLFLSHLNYIEENNLSKFTDNILIEAENIMTREPDDDSLSTKCSLPDSFRVITDATEMNSTVHETEIFDNIEKRKGLRIAGRSPYNASNPSYFVENKQTTVSAALPSIVASGYPHESSLDDSTSTMYLHQEFGPNAWNSKEYEEVPFHGKCGRRGQLTCRAVNSVPYSSARSCSRNTNAPKNLTSVSLVFGPESTLGLSNLKDRDKTQHLMHENLGCHALRCTVDLSKQEKLSPSLETSHQHGRMCCLSSADSQRSACKGDFIKHGELMVVPHCNFQQNASEIAARSVYSCSLCNCSGCCKSNAACTDKCLRCTATEQRIAVCSKEHDIQLPGCHICHSDPKTLLRLGRISSSSAVDSVNHEMCNQKKQGSYFPGKCSCAVLSSCLTGCCICGNNPSYVCTEQGFIGKDINVTLPSDNDHILKDNRIENFGCSKCHSMKNEFQAALWREVPNNVTLHADAVLTTKPARLLGVTEVIDQPAETAAKRFDMTCPEPELAKEHEMSNAWSESSAPVITEVSIERNKADVCSAEVGNPKSVFELTVDEGSGIEKCGSSDEPLENREWKEALSFTNMVDSVSPRGEHKLKNTSKVKDRKIALSTRCMDQEEVNHQMQQQRKVCRAEKMKGPMKWKSLDASIPLSHLSTENSYSSNSIDHPFPWKEVKTPLQKDKRIKRKRSVILSKSLNLNKSENHQKFCENGEAQSSGDCALKVTKLSTLMKINQDFHVDGSKQPVIQEDKKGITGKPPKYKSLGCLKKFPNHGADTCDGKVRPVVSGNSGIISDVPGSQQKPPKMVSLSVILKTAQRCCISENEAIPGLLSTSETKKVRLNASTRSRSALSSMRKGENGGCSISLRNRKQSCFLLMPSINKSCSNNDDRCADEVSIMKRETHCGIARTSKRGNFHGYVESQPRFEETRKRSVSELTGGDRHAAKSMCILRNGENSSVAEGGSVLKTYSSTCVQKNLVGRISRCENLLDKPPSNIQLSNDCQAYQDHEPCQIINRRSSKRRRCQPFIFDSDAFCCVCGSSNKEQGNYLLECNDCLIRVHQACYGVPKAPKGGWYCRPCKTNSKNIVCVLCGYKGGAMTRAIKSQNVVKSLLKAWSIDIEQKYMKAISTFKLSFDEFPEQSFIGEASECKESSSVLPVGSATCGDFQRDTPKMDLRSLPNIPGKTDSSPCNFQACNSITAGVLDSSVTQWVHMVCGLWTPGTRCPNVDTMSAFDVSGASSRKNAVCSICNRPGGSSICCRIPNCSVHFHPWCAHQKGLLQSEIEGVNNEKVGFYGRCMVHAAHNSGVVGCPVDAEVESPRQRDYNCARIEGYKGRRGDEGYRANFQNPHNDSGGCIVSQDQINAWIHINGQKSCARGVVKPACSDVESDFRKEYMRCKQAKGWRHLVVYKSGIHGLGLYTSQFIARGAMVVEYVGEIVGLRVADKREIEYQSGRKIQYKSACYFFRIDKEHIIDATRKGGIARFVNHSCLPNCVAKVISIRNEKKVVFFAERDINPGEEITYDYHFNHEDECQKIPCFCNSRNCRRYLN